MSDSETEGFIESPRGESVSTDVLEVEFSAVPQVFPGMVKPGEPADQPTAYRLQHGDIHTIPGIFGTFNDEDGNMDHEKRREWMKRCEPETPMFVDDEPDIQGWTYITDYSIHSRTPTHSGPYSYYIHARIRHDNRIQFGVFAEQYNGEHRLQLPLFSVLKEEERLLQSQLLHGDFVPPLRIAGKKEAEEMLLADGKLKQAAAPKLIGCLMNVGNARVSVTYGKTTTYFLKTYYGHIWIYWAAIIDRVFYMVGIPVYTGNDRGTLVYAPGTDGKGTRISVNLPPTEDDLRSQYGGSVFVGEDCTLAPNQGSFYRAAKLIWGVTDEYHGGFESTMVKVDDFLEKYGDKKSPIPLCKRALAVVKPGDEEDKPVYSLLSHGDIYTDVSMLGYDGGVYTQGNSLVVRNEDEVTTSFVYPKGGGYWVSESGTSGYIPTMTRYDRVGHIYYAAQAFYAGQMGNSYFIRTVGCLRPYGAYDMDSTLGGVDVALFRAKEPEEDVDDDNPYWGPGGGGGGGGGSTDDDDDDGGGGGIEDVGDVGIWWQGGDGVQVTARRDTAATKIRYTFEVEVTDKFAVTQTLHYDVKPSFSIADGGSYTVSGGKVTLTMWYYLSGSGSQVTVRNLTSKSGSGGTWVDNTHPTSSDSFSTTGFCKVRTIASFGSQYLTNYAQPSAVSQSNIVQLVKTGKTKEVRVSIVYYDENKRKHRKRVKGTMQIYTIALQKANIKNILRNYPRKNGRKLALTCSPSSITGNTSGAAGAPTVKCGKVTATPVPLPISGETEVKGSYKMSITGYYEEMQVKFTVGNGCTGWYEGEPSNRHSVDISGEFTMTSPFKRF